MEVRVRFLSRFNEILRKTSLMVLALDLDENDGVESSFVSNTKSTSMRLTVVSHPCVVAANQDFFARVQEHSGWEVTIVVPARWNNEYGHQHAEHWPAFHGEVISLPVVRQGSIPLHLYRARLSKLFLRLRPAALYVHNEPYAASTFQCFQAMRRVGTGPAGFYSAQNLLKRYRWPFSAMERSVFSQAGFALPVSMEVGSVLRAKGYLGQLEVLPLGVDAALAEAGDAQGHRLAGSDREFTLGYVGRLSREKGIDTLLEALPLLPSDRVRALIVGDGPAAGELRMQASKLGLEQRVTWRGYVDHRVVNQVYGEIDLLVVPSRTVPSWKEQFGRVVLEALVHGIPVVTSNSGELPSLVERTGGGWTFPEGDRRALARIVTNALEDRAELYRRGAIGRTSVLRLFDLESVAARFAAVVSEARERFLLGRRAGTTSRP